MQTLRRAPFITLANLSLFFLFDTYLTSSSDIVNTLLVYLSVIEEFDSIWMFEAIGLTYCIESKREYRGVFEIQKSGDKTSSGEIGLDIRTHASPKVGQDQVSGGVSVLCWLAAPVAYVLWKPCTIR